MVVDDKSTQRKGVGKVIRRGARDITEVRTSQNMRTRGDSVGHARRTQAIFNQVLESISDGVFILEVQAPGPLFRVIYVNASFEKMTGFRKEEILGRNFFSFQRSKVASRRLGEIQKGLRRGRPFVGELPQVKKSGQKYWVFTSIRPVEDGRHDVTHFVGLMTDVTMIRRREGEIEDLRGDFLHVARVGKLAEFVSSLAHEINQPLTSILSYAQAAKRLARNQEPLFHEILEHIINDDHRAALTIQRLRSLLKKADHEMKAFDLHVLIQETLELIGMDAVVRKVTLTTHLSDPSPWVNGDRVQIQQVLLNLLSNSLDAMSGEDSSRQLEVSTTNQHSSVVVKVKDSGCGIPEKNLSKLFAHFFTSKPEGLGMGLSISRSIVEAHGGRLNGSNNPEGGATFSFTLPVENGDRIDHLTSLPPMSTVQS